VKKRLETAGPAYKYLGHGACDTISRSMTLDKEICQPQEIFDEATKIYKKLNILPSDLRGIGIHLSKLVFHNHDHVLIKNAAQKTIQDWFSNATLNKNDNAGTTSTSAITSETTLTVKETTQAKPTTSKPTSTSTATTTNTITTATEITESPKQNGKLPKQVLNNEIIYVQSQDVDPIKRKIERHQNLYSNNNRTVPNSTQIQRPKQHSPQKTNNTPNPLIFVPEIFTNLEPNFSNWITSITSPCAVHLELIQQLLEQYIVCLNLEDVSLLLQKLRNIAKKHNQWKEPVTKIEQNTQNLLFDLYGCKL